MVFRPREKLGGSALQQKTRSGAGGTSYTKDRKKKKYENHYESLGANEYGVANSRDDATHTRKTFCLSGGEPAMSTVCRRT